MNYIVKREPWYHVSSSDPASNCVAVTIQVRGQSRNQECPCIVVHANTEAQARKTADKIRDMLNVKPEEQSP